MLKMYEDEEVNTSACWSHCINQKDCVAVMASSDYCNLYKKGDKYLFEKDCVSIAYDHEKIDEAPVLELMSSKEIIGMNPFREYGDEDLGVDKCLNDCLDEPLCAALSYCTSTYCSEEEEVCKLFKKGEFKTSEQSKYVTIIVKRRK
jgi:hypothetical protein